MYTKYEIKKSKFGNGNAARQTAAVDLMAVDLIDVEINLEDYPIGLRPMLATRNPVKRTAIVVNMLETGADWEVWVDEGSKKAVAAVEKLL